MLLFCDHFDLNRDVKGKLRDSYGASGVKPLLAKHFREQIRDAVHHGRLLQEVRRRGHKRQHFDDTHLVQIIHLIF